jgi:hypothetical protein
MEEKMTNDLKFISKKGNARVGLTIHLDLFDDSDPFDINLYFKRPCAEEEELPGDDKSVSASGKLVFKFGDKGYIKLFADKTFCIDADEIEDVLMQDGEE